MRVERIGRRGPAVALAAALLVAAGCGDKMGQVDGKLVWSDGTPAKELEGSQVVFESAATRTTARRGTVGPDGGFKLGTKTRDDGAPVGEYQVVVVENRKNANAEGTVLMPALLAAKYGELKTSELTATVKSGINPVVLTVERAGKN